MNNLGIPDDKLGALLEIAGKKLGRNPQELREQLQSGKLDSVISGMDPKSAGQLQGILQNPKAVEAMLQNNKIKNLLGALMDGRK